LQNLLLPHGQHRTGWATGIAQRDAAQMMEQLVSHPRGANQFVECNAPRAWTSSAIDALQGT
jgi:hypothetical protein